MFGHLKSLNYSRTPLLRTDRGEGLQPSTVNYQLSTVNYQLSTVNFQLSTINCQLSTTNYQLSTINYQLSTINSYVPHSHLVLVPQLVDGALSA